MKSLQPWFKLWHEAKDTRTSSLGENEVNRGWNGVEVSEKVFVNEVCKFSKFLNHGLPLPCLVGGWWISSKMPVGHFSPLVATIPGLTTLPWSFMGDFLVFVGFESANSWHTRGHFHLLQTWSVHCTICIFLAFSKCWVTKYQVVSTTRSSFHSISSSQVSESAAFGKVPLPSCRRVMAFRCRISLDFAKVAGHVHILLGTLVRSCCRLFSLTILFPCRNLRERRQDLQARDFQCLSDLSSR